MNNVSNRFINDIYIQPETPVLDVPYIILNAVFHITQLLCLSTKTGHLAPPRNAGLHKMPHHVFIYQLRILFRMLQHIRAGPHNTHIPQQHIDKLRRLVKVRLAQYASPTRHAGIPLGGLHPVGITVHFHAPELITIKLLVIQSVPFLFKEYGSRHGTPRHNGHHYINNRKQST